jgi:hypothetical protein
MNILDGRCWFFNQRWNHREITKFRPYFFLFNWMQFFFEKSNLKKKENKSIKKIDAKRDNVVNWLFTF